MTKITEMTEEHSPKKLDDAELAVRKFCKHMLKTQIFPGTYLEKRYVQPLNDYRDIVKVDDQEDQFIKNLIAVQRRLSHHFRERKWIGITFPETVGAPVGYNLWVSLNSEIFGTYWFEVSSISFRGNEIALKLNILRPYVIQKSLAEKSNTSTTNSEESSNKSINITGDLLNKTLDLKDISISFAQVKDTVVFIVVFMAALITATGKILQYLLEYSLKLTRELSFLIRNLTPIAIATINMIGKVIMGFYYTIVLMWKEVFGKKTSVPQDYYGSRNNSITYRQSGPYAQNVNAYYSRRALPPARQRSSVVITPLD